MKPAIRPRLAVFAALFAASAAAHAGRPLVVDDANVNEPGNGHVESWVARTPGSTPYSLAPAYAPIEGLEIGALIARDRDTSQRLSAVQVKWRITRSREDGCNLGLVVGIGHASGDGNTAYANGLATCNLGGAGSVHVNLGTAKARNASAIANWGIAYERAFGPVIPHVEWFGAEGTKSTAQAGLRGDIAQGVQLDGSVGRSGGRTVYTLGVKFQF